MTCIPGSGDVKRPLAVVGGRHNNVHIAHSWRLSDRLEFSTQHSTSMSGRQGGKLKPLKVNIPFNDTDSWSL